MMRHNVKRGNWRVTVPLAAGSIAYVAFVFLPGQGTTTELRRQIRDKQEHLAQAQSVGAALVASEEELRMAKQHRAQWRKNVPRVAHLSELFAGIHGVEKRSGVQTVRFDPQPVVRRAYLSEVPVSLGCVGAFAEVFALLYGLECLPVKVWVKRMHLEKVGSDSGNVQCRVDLLIFADNREKKDYVKKSN